MPDTQNPVDADPTRGPESEFELSRRAFVQMLGAGLLISVSLPALGQESVPAGRGRQRMGRPAPTGTIAARIHVGRDGALTVLTGKVEGGQGARAELTQAAAEEMRVSPDRIQLIMGDTGLVPDDGITAGSRSTPSTVPAVRQAAAAAREMLVTLAMARWDVNHAFTVVDGKIAARSTSVTVRSSIPPASAS